MEGIQNDLRKLNLAETKGKSGILYDRQMLEHLCDKKNHVECPERVQTILETLSKSGLLMHPSLEVLDKAKPASNSEISLAHKSNYIDLIFNMWPEETSKKTLWLKDSYYNRLNKKKKN